MSREDERDTLTGLDLEEMLEREPSHIRLLGRYTQRAHEAIVRVEGFAFRAARDAAETRAMLEERLRQLESRPALAGGTAGAVAVVLLEVLRAAGGG